MKKEAKTEFPVGDSLGNRKSDEESLRNLLCENKRWDSLRLKYYLNLRPERRKNKKVSPPSVPLKCSICGRHIEKNDVYMVPRYPSGEPILECEACFNVSYQKSLHTSEQILPKQAYRNRALHFIETGRYERSCDAEKFENDISKFCSYLRPVSEEFLQSFFRYLPKGPISKDEINVIIAFLLALEITEYRKIIPSFNKEIQKPGERFSIIFINSYEPDSEDITDYVHGIIDRHFLNEVDSETKIIFIPWIWEEVWIPKEIIAPYTIQLATGFGFEEVWGMRIDRNRLGYYCLVTNEDDPILVIFERRR